MSEILPRVNSLNTMAPLLEDNMGSNADIIANHEAAGFKIVRLIELPPMPFILLPKHPEDLISPLPSIFDGLSDEPPKISLKLFDIDYFSAEDRLKVDKAREVYQEFIELYGEENVQLVSPTMEVAAAHGQMYQEEVKAIMVRPLNKQFISF